MDEFDTTKLAWTLSPSVVVNGEVVYTVVSAVPLSEPDAQMVVSQLLSRNLLAKAELKKAPAKPKITGPTLMEMPEDMVLKPSNVKSPYMYIGVDTGSQKVLLESQEEAITWWLEDTKNRRLFRGMWHGQQEVSVMVAASTVKLIPTYTPAYQEE